ncbi:MAG TPA: hypothetical protein P5284_09635 [Candidatus Contendobacter sp.]|jgi:hypothetical protein|nr:hypothetical protein [Candidatus Contendobacter sp.]HRZ22624.1 hypothetical protein [Candidatus Contendobacter sp.]HRZ53415.1 hypothetical protein [Candidatus Contendobacter sp.]
MRQQSREYIVILFIVGVLALNYPVLELFNRPWMPFGIPALYLYLYLTWLVLIILLIVVVERSQIPEPDQTAAPPEPAPRSEAETASAEKRGTSNADPAESP